MTSRDFDREEFLKDRDALSNMSLSELWRLFPVSLVDHRDEWTEQAAEEIACLAGLLHDRSPVITHVGSTAIPAICAKPIVDILVELPDLSEPEPLILLMEGHGYICMSISDGRLSFNKGYTRRGYAGRVFHIHFRMAGDNAEIAFRDYLRTHPEMAREYEKLKLSLLPEFRLDRDGYTDAKGDFVRHILSLSETDRNEV